MHLMFSQLNYLPIKNIPDDAGNTTFYKYELNE